MKTTILKLMRTGLSAGTFFAATVVFALGEYESHLTNSFSVSPGGELVVDADRGAIEVATADTDKVEVEVIRKVRAASQSRANEIFADHEVGFQQQAGRVSVSAKYHGASGGLFNRAGAGLQVRYHISIPKKFNVDLKTAGGSITMTDLTGAARTQTSGGGLKLSKIDGPVWGKTSGGSISLASGSGAVEVHTSGGSIHIGEAGNTVSARTSGGSIRLDEAKGDVVAETSGGNIQIGAAGGSIGAETSGGKITIKSSHGKVSAKTSGGNIDAGEVRGSLDAETSGGSISASLPGQPTEECHLKTSGGGIRLICAESLAVNLDAKTSGGRVVTDLPVTVTGKQQSNELRGKINGGGPALLLRTSGGSIYLNRR